ncbi:MAG TPA: hypothetical protein VFF04_02235 [Candidatus Babeliales bacterium]|nr:hypothetical protein [Candidatus Babeliales bacterium]
MNKTIAFALIILSITSIKALPVDVDLINYSDKQVTVSLLDEAGNDMMEPAQLADRDSLSITNVPIGEYTFRITYMGVYQSVAGISETDSTNTIDEETSNFYIDTDLKVKPEAEEETEQEEQPSPPSSPIG